MIDPTSPHSRSARRPRRWLPGTVFAAAVVLLAACQAPPPSVRPSPASAAPAAAIASEPRREAAATAHPLATAAALQMLAEGGGVVDAAIAAQMVLGLVEPQSSGIGGGTLLMLWTQRDARLRAYDGLAAAPARTTPALRVDVDGQLLPAQQVARGGRSVGVPGTLAVLELAHRRHGRLPWARLFEPAIRLAEQGYPLAPYAHGILARDPGAREHPAFRADHFDASGTVLPAGTLLRNPAYAGTLRTIAASGVDGFWRSGAAARLVAATRQAAPAGLIEVDDVLRYRAAEREPLCVALPSPQPVRACLFAPPSFGGVAALQMLQMLQGERIDAARLADPAFWHRYAEAGRLARADRMYWAGDPDFVAVPAQALVAPAYIAARAALIDDRRAGSGFRHGEPVPPRAAQAPEAGREAADATSQLVVADASGDVLSMTTTINLNFGSRLRVDGYVLNNAMTNFASDPARRGERVANQMAPGKRPVTAMSPLIVFDASGRPLIAGGSAGGGQIVDYIVRNLIEMLWLDRTPAQALAGGHVTTALAPRIQLEADTPRAALAGPLKALGHDVAVEPTVSGAAFLRRRGDGWIGGSDPRRDGDARGR